MGTPLEDDVKNAETREARVVVATKVSAAARQSLIEEASRSGMTLSGFARRLLAIGLRHWKRGER